MARVSQLTPPTLPMATLLLTFLLFLTTVSSTYGAQTVVSNTCKSAATGPCEIVLETKTTGPGAQSATLTSDASCERYSTPQRPCTQSGISIESTVVHGSSSGNGPSHISTSVVVVSDGGSNSVSESSNVPSSSNATTTRRLVCTCGATTVTSTTSSTVTKTTVPHTSAPVAVVSDKKTTVSVATVHSSDQYSDRMAKAIATAVKENEEFAEQIRKSRLAFQS